MQITKELALEAKKKDKLAFHNEELNYARFTADFRNVQRGTIIIGDRIIVAYPYIKRIFTLERGIDRNIKNEEIYIEEKIDGYNLRIAQINGIIFAFSRGGFIDYFATEKARDIISKKFFIKYPNLILCAEVIGNTPYTKPTKEFDIKILVFDIDKGNGEYLPCKDKYSLLKRFRIDSVPIIAKIKKTNLPKIKQVVVNIFKAKKEGIVIKTPDRKEAIKYVNVYSDINDIETNAKLFFDMPLGFYLQRILRSTIFIRDFDLNHKDYAKKLGTAFYENLLKGITELEKNGEISEEYEITIKSIYIWNKLLRQMSKEVKIEKIFEREENGKIRIRFRKIYMKTTRKLRELLSGKGMED